MQGRCIDPGAALSLEINRIYYLFDNGTGFYYVSKFNNQKAHFGCYQAAHFQVIHEQQEEWPREPEAVTMKLEIGKLYLAHLVWRKKGYKHTKLQEYFVRANQTHGYFFTDPQLKYCGGCFPLHWFANFREIEEPESVQEIEKNVQVPPEIVHKDKLTELLEMDNGQLAFF